ncbi:MAG: replication factor C small subunit [Candidatus Thermoplasmatota archaeon]|nr:replication factor C small subunit [Candidatus Thermoplasmatota archaeon]MED5485919.1 replication factor C small subunit [Candidatus Thermoplasmatota archaeon]MEE3135031.1 replication factor C small subunit [Candidatus Thermoplasmatota archaeon]CAI8233420.1 MAG: DNA polymerase III subunit tau [Euryarchaeota archaeon]|tara:strand:+ start:4665 stop:5633 length:969 start_codon:yes stop_codon:yes gene_type:complete
MSAMDELWVEKHRPRSVNEIKGQPSIVSRLRAYADNGTFPHLMLAGPPGTGKTTAAMALTRDIYGDEFRNNLLEMNASDERKLESIRTKVKNFARTSPYGNAPFKIIFLDEADALTNDAQGALRRIMEQHAATCRFILSCNYSSKIIEPIQSRCAVFRFRPLANDQVETQIKFVAESEEVELDQDACEAIVRVSLGDLRKAITALQVAAAVNKKVTRELVYETTATAPPEVLHQYLLACREDGFHAARRRLKEILNNFGLAGTDFINQLHRTLYDVDFLTEPAKLELTRLMAEIDFRLVEGGGEQLQLDSLTAHISTVLKNI